jgi:hypothetical protein
VQVELPTVMTALSFAVPFWPKLVSAGQAVAQFLVSPLGIAVNWLYTVLT